MNRRPAPVDRVAEVLPAPIKRKCGSLTRDGKPCTHGAGARTDHPGEGPCWLHGGRTPAAQKSGLVKAAERAAALMSVPVDIDPMKSLLTCVRVAAGDVAFAEMQIQRILDESGEDGLLVRPVSVKKRPLDLGQEGEDPGHQVEEVTTGPPQIHAWLVFKQQAMERWAKFSKMCLDAGLEERLVRVEEDQAQRVVRAIRGILGDVGVDETSAVSAIVRKHLMQMDDYDVESTAEEID